MARLLLAGEGAVEVCAGALRAATQRQPTPSVVALAVGVLHVLGAEADAARRGAMGRRAGHRVQLLGAPEGAARRVSVAQYAHGLKGDEQEVAVEQGVPLDSLELQVRLRLHPPQSPRCH